MNLSGEKEIVVLNIAESMPVNAVEGGNDEESTSAFPENIQESGQPEMDFLNSLKAFTDKDIPENGNNKKKSPGLRSWLRYAALAVCAGVFIFSAYNIVLQLISYAKEKASNDNLRAIYYGEKEPDSASFIPGVSKSLAVPKSYETLSGEGGGADSSGYISITVDKDNNFKKQLEKIEKFEKINRDMFGWIYVGMVKIDYPVVQGKDNIYYLEHAFEKYASSNGTIFCDADNDRDIEKNRNTVLYGHNMKDGSMFRPLLQLKEKESLFKQGYIEFTTKTGIFVYEVFSVHVVSPLHRYFHTQFEDDEEWIGFLNELQSRSVFKKDITFTAEDRIITLSTCTNDGSARVAVHGILREIIR